MIRLWRITSAPARRPRSSARRGRRPRRRRARPRRGSRCPLISSGIAMPKRSRIVGAMSVASTKPGVRVVSEVRLPSKPSPAIPIASVSRFGGGGRSIAISRSSPRRRSTSAGQLARVAGTTVTPGHRGPMQRERRADRCSLAVGGDQGRRAQQLVGAGSGSPASSRVDASRPGTMSAGASSARSTISSQPGDPVLGAGRTIGVLAVVQRGEDPVPGADVEVGLRRGDGREPGAHQPRRHARATSPMLDPARCRKARTATVTAGGSSCAAGRGRATRTASPRAPAPAATNLDLVPERTFVKFTFFKVDPAWRRRSAAERARDKAEFQAACDDFAEDRSLRAYSTVGTRGDTDLLLLSQSPILEDLHTFHVVLGQSGLARWADDPLLLPGDDEALALLGGVGAPGDRRLRAQVPVRLPLRQEARVVRAAARGAPADHDRATSRSAAATPRSRSTPPTPSASTTRSSSSPSRATTPASSSTSCRSCAPPSRAPTRCATPRSSLASRCRSPRALDALDGTAATAAVPRPG